jgi:VWFA-related protein
MTNRALALAASVLIAATAYAQDKPPKPNEDQVIRIGTKLVQLDAVVVDKSGKIVKGLTQDDFELLEGGKKQQISFFEFVEAGGLGHIGGPGKPSAAAPVAPSRQGPGEGEIRRIFAFVIDDLTIRGTDMYMVRQMLTNFVDNRMQPSDLVAIIRTVGGKGLLQTFTTDKELLRRAIAALSVATNPFSAFDNPDAPDAVAFAAASGASSGGQPVDLSGSASADIASAQDDTNKVLRAFMALGTASFVIDSMKELPGRKAMVLVSGGLPILGSGAGSVTGDVSYFLNRLADQATRAGVVINTLDIRGLSAQVGVADFRDTPGKSAMGATSGSGFGRTVDESQFANKNPFDVADAHMGLRQLSSSTGGLAILNRNDFNAGLDRIVETSDAYYLLAYTPTDANFKNEFRKVTIKVKNGYKVYSRSGYFAREEHPPAAPISKEDQLLAAIKSPLARKELPLDAEVLYKAATPDKGAIGIDLVIDPKKVSFELADGKEAANVDVAGFVFDELGKLRGGFNQTLSLSLSPEEYNQIMTGGLTYSQSTELKAGIYQIRLAARDNKTGNLGTISRYMEVPDLSKGRFTASSVMLGSAPVGEMKAGDPTPISANRRIPKKSDLRYAVFIYNAKAKDGKPQVRTQMIISQAGQVIYKAAEDPVPFSGSNASQLVRVGQLGLSRVKPGRYTISILITDPLADKKAQTISRSAVFEVVE